MKDYDNSLSQIDGLKWLPWVGDHFNSAPPACKILVVGESHYQDEDDQKSIDKHKSPDYTRKVIRDIAINRNYYNTRLFPNLHRAIFRTDKFDSEAFWNSVCFYNFVQRPMNKTKNEKPSNSDFYNGWKPFFELVEVLNPSVCLFSGVIAANFLAQATKDSGLEMPQIHRGEKISRTFPRKTVLWDKSGRPHKLEFIQHTSHHFSWRKWNDYLKTEIPAQLEWLEKEIKENITPNNT